MYVWMSDYKDSFLLLVFADDEDSVISVLSLSLEGTSVSETPAAVAVTDADDDSDDREDDDARDDDCQAGRCFCVSCCRST